MRAVVLTWTGLEVHALRRAMRLSVVRFATVIGRPVRVVTLWEAQCVTAKLRPVSQALLDTVLAGEPPVVRERFAVLAIGLRDVVTASGGRVKARDARLTVPGRV